MGNGGERVDGKGRDGMVSSFTHSVLCSLPPTHGGITEVTSDIRRPYESSPIVGTLDKTAERRDRPSDGLRNRALIFLSS